MALPTKTFPLDRFLIELERQGMEVDLRKRIALQRVLDNAGDWLKRPASDVGKYLAPVVARSPEEQALFYQVWDTFLASEAEDDASQTEEWSRNLFSLRLRKIILGGLFGLVVLLLAWLYLWPLEVGDFHVDARSANGGARIEAGDRVVISAAGEDIHANKPLRWQIDGKDTLAGMSFEQSFEEGVHNVVLTREARRLWRTEDQADTLSIEVFCKGQPDVDVTYLVVDSQEVLYEVKARDGNPGRLRVDWTFPDSTHGHALGQLRRYDELGLKEVAYSIIDTAYPLCPKTGTVTVDLGKEQLDTNAIAQLPDLAPLPPQYDYSRHIAKKWLFGIPLAGAAITFFAALGVRRRRNRKQSRDMAQRQARFALDPNGPYNIPWPSQDHLIAWDENLDRVAAAMTGRSVGERLHLDIAGSIHATVRRAGMPQLRFKGQMQPMSWLVLVDEASLTEQEQRLISWWLQQLRSETVIVDEYHFRNRPDHCWKRGKTGLIAIHQLQAQFATHRLIVVSRGEGLMHPVLNAVAESVHDAVRPWAHRTLLTPESPHVWAGREKALSSLFGLCPVDNSAMLKYFLLANVPDGEGYRAWKKELLRRKPLFLPSELPVRLGSWQILRTALGGHLADWVMALHTYPEPVWELTVATGARLQGPDQRVTWDALWQVLSLPMLQQGRYSPKLKKEAAENASHAVIRSGHKTVIELLAGAKAILAARGQRGVANTEIERELALQEFAINPGGREERLAIAAMQAEGLDLDVQLDPERKKRRWHPIVPAGFVLLILTVLSLSLQQVKTSVGATNKDDMLTSLDSVEMTADWINMAHQIHATYVEGKKAYDAKSYNSASTIFEEQINKLETEFDQPPVSSGLQVYLDGASTWAKFHNAAGLAAYYNDDKALATDHLVSTLKYNVNFYRYISPALPNLQTILDSTESLIRQVDGTVLDKDGRPVPDATITVARPADNVSGFPGASSDAEGKFVLRYIPTTDQPEDDSVEVTAGGFMRRVLPVPGYGRLNVILQRRECSNAIRMRGYVHGANGAKIPKFEVAIHAARSIDYVSQGFNAEICGKLGYQVKVIVRADGYERLDTVVTLGTTHNFVLWRPAKTILSGTVTDENGKGIVAYGILMNGKLMKGFPDFDSDYFDIRSDEEWPGLTKVTIVADGYTPVELDLKLPATNQQFKLTPLDNSQKQPNGDFMLTVSSANYGRRVMDFEVFVDDVSIRVANPKDDGRVRIARTALNGDGGTIKIKAKGYADYSQYYKSFEDVTILLDLHPAIVGLLSSLVEVDAPKGDYKIGAYEVTQAQWTALMGSNPSIFKNCPTCPVENVSWLDCQGFVQSLNQITGKRFRLPTVSEWEYAAKGGINPSNDPYAGDKVLSNVAWFQANSANKTYPVGTKAPNALELYDISGNVAEWCDISTNGQQSDAMTRPAKGGAYLSPAADCQINAVGNEARTARKPYLGFRIVGDY